MYRTERVALVLLDDTVADYEKALSEAMSSLQSSAEPDYDREYPRRQIRGLGFSHEYLEARRRMIQRQPGFWRNLEPLPLGLRVTKELDEWGFVPTLGLQEGTELTVATVPVRMSNRQERIEWCQEHLPGANIILIERTKPRAYGQILVANNPTDFDPWLRLQREGLIICVAQPWNEDFAKGGPWEHPNIFRYDGTSHMDLRRRIQSAYGLKNTTGQTRLDRVRDDNEL